MTNKEVKMPRGSSAERREQIVDALERLLLQRTFADISVSELAGQAGLATGLVHYHFTSKRAVLLALVERVVDAFTRRLEAAPADPVAAARNMIYAALARGPDARPDRARVWVALSAEATRSDDVATAMRPVLSEVEARLLRAFECIGSDDPERAALAVLCAMDGAGRLGVVGQFEPGAAAETVVAVFDAFLAAGRG